MQLELSVDVELLDALPAPHRSSIVSLVDLTDVHLGLSRFRSVLYIHRCRYVRISELTAKVFVCVKLVGLPFVIGKYVG